MCMYDARGCSTAHAHVGYAAQVQMYIAQLFCPLSNLGVNYRTLTQAMADLEAMALLLQAFHIHTHTDMGTSGLPHAHEHVT